MKARIVRHKGAHFRAAPLAKHISYLERDGVTRDGRDARLFDQRGDDADRTAFAKRCEEDRHHFRFIVSPEDATEIEDLRRFTRELLIDMEKDLGTKLDWVAVDHWNTDNPHIHILVRGVADDGSDLVIDRGYVSEGLRYRAEERATIELGPRSERDIQRAREAEVGAECWTSLDRDLAVRMQENGGLVDLRPDATRDHAGERLLRGRAAKLEQLGLATLAAPGQWLIDASAEETLRTLSVRGDIIKTMHRAMARTGARLDPAAMALHAEAPADPIVGRLVDRGLHDELAGTAYAIVDGTDGRTHHLRFDDMAMTGDAAPGAIVELRQWEGRRGQAILSLAVRSDLPLADQIAAPGATWLDRQLVAREPAATGGGFGLEVRSAMAERISWLEGQGLARRQGGRCIPAPGLVDTLRSRELGSAAAEIAARSGLPYAPPSPGDAVRGTYRERVTLASGRFAMIDDGLGFQLVPWRPALDAHLGRPVAGTVTAGGGIDWTMGRSKGIAL